MITNSDHQDSDLHDFGLLDVKQLVDTVNLGIGQFLDGTGSLMQFVLGDFAIAFEALEPVISVSPDIADGDLCLFGILSGNGA